MDSLTQVLLGAAVGEAVAGRKAGNKAILWGGICGTIPDLDIISGYFMDTVDSLAFHRGMTHSIVFALMLAPIIGYGLHKLYKKNPTTWREWSLLAFLALFTHPLLDCFTTWGTQLFWPFSDYRVAIKSIFVIDPLYTLPLLICLLWLVFLHRESNKRRKLNFIGLSVSSFYLLITLIVKLQANAVFEASFQEKGLEVLRYDTKPAPLNIILWSATLEVKDGYYIGHYSFLDEDKDVVFYFFPKNHQLLSSLSENKKVQKLINISDRWFTIEPSETGVIYNDLRFGQSSGWESGTGKFVFSYNIVQENGEVRIRELEKDFTDGRAMLRPLWERILGK